jgi:hypothetical protein
MLNKNNKNIIKKLLNKKDILYKISYIIINKIIIYNNKINKNIL